MKPIIDKLKDKYEIIITARDLAQTIPLLKAKNIPYIEIGSHYNNKFFKVLEVFSRSLKLYKYIKKLNQISVFLTVHIIVLLLLN